ncbi:MAG: alanine--tRNA ligase [Anaerolineae bacterium CG_4_9_14_3_um_filter_57_17]|nr:alanine--tRNA ligase [bacterium]NCT19949.1 alanine--tRNA ligase [bacterium]OIO85979.1 MAG: alanine--tRNA ligase [Anaerolineae bacterium CG2_30_57_67]PJB65915.1 MAG: alanine--tRNA ligase [Anaerolineae bacterium CG_4_9_14_3_um_filter_57_17]
MSQKPTGNQIRQTFLDFFVERGHTAVPSMSLVPGGDATLLFTNSGMVQFKDVFIGTDKRPYTRAVDSQKCMRVAGKHNDLDDVGRDDTHHTFFEMLGNWSFGDYYKEDAIAWSWQLLTEVWGLPKDKLYATCFKDDKGNIPQDDEAADIWKKQPGFDPANVLFFGRKENFWQMAETGPCGPCSEIHMDLGEERDNLRGQPHQCGVNGECTRYLELWNNVFMQYNLLPGGGLEPLPATHVDTGMGFERIVSVLQGVDSNYKTDLFRGALDALSELTGKTRAEIYADFTPYRVIADHARSAAFLIGDGVVPGNAGRNYVCRMIIRRAARFGGKIGLRQPFLAQVADAFISEYGGFYPELTQNRQTILDNLTREEIRFARTVESGTGVLQNLLDALKNSGQSVLDGHAAFDLYATYGLPLEISRDIAREQGLDVDEAAFRAAREEHSLASGGGKAMGQMGGDDAEFFSGIFKELLAQGKLGQKGVAYDPYSGVPVTGELLALVVDGQSISEAQVGDRVEVILPAVNFYIESGGQMGDTGVISGSGWEIEISDVRRPAAGLISCIGEVLSGRPKVGEAARAEVDSARRHDIMRNHTATHLLHKALHTVLGDHARQAGSLVAPTHLRFDFTHPDAMTPEQIERVEKMVNEAVARDMPVQKQTKAREEAVAEGAMALFGEKYGEVVRTITVADDAGRYSYELCGGTHLDRTSDVGAFLLVSESSAAAGIRRIEAVTGRGAYELIAKRSALLKTAAAALKTAPDEVPAKVETLQDELAAAKKQLAAARAELALATFSQKLAEVQTVSGVTLLVTEIPGLEKDSLTKLADAFRAKFPQNGVCVIVSGEQIMAAVTQDLIKKGVKAGDLVGHLSRQLGAGGGGAPHLAFGGGRELTKLLSALASVSGWLAEKVN